MNHFCKKFLRCTGGLVVVLVTLGTTMRTVAQDVVRGNVYVEKILVANRAGFDPDALIDDHMINPWGIALRPPGAGGHIWISNAGNLSTSTYIGDAKGMPLHQDGL